MAARRELVCGENTARVERDGTLQVVVHPHPPEIEETLVLPFRQFLTDNGSSSGSNDMQVVGTAAIPIEFWASANHKRDIFIKTLSIEITDASASLNKFGNVTALSNGCELVWITKEEGEIVIADNLKSNYDFVRLGLGSPAIGSTTTAFRASNVSGNSEGYIPTVDFSTVFGMPWGMRLRKGTNDRLLIRIKDTTTGVDSFNILAYGIKR
jgi:hypothetical protein